MASSVNIQTRVPSSIQMDDLYETCPIDDSRIYDEDGKFSDRGLFSPQIWPAINTCSCGRTSGSRYVGMVCPYCNSEVLSAEGVNAKVGLIKLANPDPGIYRDIVNELLPLTMLQGKSESQIQRYYNGERVLILYNETENLEEDGQIFQRTFEKSLECNIDEAEKIMQSLGDKGVRMLSCGDLIKYALSQLRAQDALDKLLEYKDSVLNVRAFNQLYEENKVPSSETLNTFLAENEKSFIESESFYYAAVGPNNLEKALADAGSPLNADEVKQTITEVAEVLEQAGYTMVTGGEPGVESLFSDAVKNTEKIKAYVPSQSSYYTQKGALKFNLTEADNQSVLDYHPVPSKLNDIAKRAVARYNCEVLGSREGGTKKVDFVLCAGPLNRYRRTSGNYTQALRIAWDNDIPVFNLLDPDSMRAFKAFVLDRAKEKKKIALARSTSGLSFNENRLKLQLEQIDELQTVLESIIEQSKQITYNRQAGRFDYPINLGDLVSRYVVVSSPLFRPMTTGGSVKTVGDLNNFYIRLIEDSQFYNSLISQNAPLAEKIRAKTESSKHYEELLNYQVGLFVDKYKSPVKAVLDKQKVEGTATVNASVNYNLALDEAALSYKCAYTLYEPFIVARLMENLSIDKKEAENHLKRETPQARKALEEIIGDRVVMIMRYPVLHEHSIIFKRPVLIKEDPDNPHFDCQVHPADCKPLNLDFDGDTLRLQGFWDREVEQKVKDYISTSPNLFSSSTGEILCEPRQDSALGIFYATRNACKMSYPYRIIVDKIKNIGSYNRLFCHRLISNLKTNSNDKVLLFDESGRLLNMTEKGLFVPKNTAVTLKIETGEASFLAKDNDAILRKDKDGYVFYDFEEKTLNIPSSYTISDKKIFAEDEEVAVQKQVPRISRIDEIRAKLKNSSMLYNEKIIFVLDGKEIETTPGRVLFNDIISGGNLRVGSFQNRDFTSKALSSSLQNISWQYERSEFAKIVQDLWKFGFDVSRDSGIGTKIGDFSYRNIKMPTKEIQNAFKESLLAEPDNTLAILINSGARGSWNNAYSVALGVGSVIDKDGEIFPQEIEGNYRDGLSAIDMLPSNVSAEAKSNKSAGVAETGAMTNKIKATLEDLRIVKDDCKTVNYETVPLKDSVFRYLVEDIVDEKDNCIAKKGTYLTPPVVSELLQKGISSVDVRSVLGCECKSGVCQKCYGLSGKTRKEVNIGISAGILAASNFGESATQNLLNVNKGGTIISSLNTVLSSFQYAKIEGLYNPETGQQDSNKTSEYLNTPLRIDKYIQHMQEVAQKNEQIYENLNLNVQSRHVEVLVKAMYDKVRIDNKGNTNLKAGYVYSISDVLCEIRKAGYKENELPTVKPVPADMDNVKYESYVRCPKSRKKEDSYNALKASSRAKQISHILSNIATNKDSLKFDR